MADIEDYKSSLEQYTDNVDMEVLKNMARTYSLVMSKQDSRYVSCTDETERVTVRDNFLKKKLGLTDSDADLDGAVMEICQKMKKDKLKSRLTFYYLLAEKYGKLQQFA